MISDYWFCSKPHHDTEKKSFVCIDSKCLNQEPICGQCAEESHPGHHAIGTRYFLKEFKELFLVKVKPILDNLSSLEKKYHIDHMKNDIIEIRDRVVNNFQRIIDSLDKINVIVNENIYQNILIKIDSLDIGDFNIINQVIEKYGITQENYQFSLKIPDIDQIFKENEKIAQSVKMFDEQNDFYNHIKIMYEQLKLDLDSIKQINSDQFNEINNNNKENKIQEQNDQISKMNSIINNNHYNNQQLIENSNSSNKEKLIIVQPNQIQSKDSSKQIKLQKQCKKSQDIFYENKDVKCEYNNNSENVKIFKDYHKIQKIIMIDENNCIIISKDGVMSHLKIKENQIIQELKLNQQLEIVDGCYNSKVDKIVLIDSNKKLIIINCLIKQNINKSFGEQIQTIIDNVPYFCLTYNFNSILQIICENYILYKDLNQIEENNIKYKENIDIGIPITIISSIDKQILIISDELSLVILEQKKTSCEKRYLKINDLNGQIKKIDQVYLREQSIIIMEKNKIVDVNFQKLKINTILNINQSDVRSQTTYFSTLDIICSCTTTMVKYKKQYKICFYKGNLEGYDANEMQINSSFENISIYDFKDNSFILIINEHQRWEKLVIINKSNL